jgi:hypothetical protein
LIAETVGQILKTDSPFQARSGTLGANIAVLAGILFLAFELQQNTLATQLEAASNFQNSYSEIELLIAGNPEFAALLQKGRGGETVSDTDQFRLSVFYGNVLLNWQFNHFQHLSGALDEKIWHGNRVKLPQIIREDRGLLNHWRAHKLQFSSAFNDMVSSITSDHP